jgi:hypothetical protein
MSYTPEKLADAKTRYRVAMEEAEMSLAILYIIEDEGGKITGLLLADKLIKRGLSNAATAADLCDQLEMGKTEIIRLTDDLLDFGLGELL